MYVACQVNISTDCFENARGNRAAYGSFAATNVNSISVANTNSSEYAVESSGQVVNKSIPIVLLDFYSQVVSTGNELGSAEIVYSSTTDAYSSIQGTTVVTAQNGIALFNAIIVTYAPEKNTTLRFDLNGVYVCYYNIIFRYKYIYICIHIHIHTITYY